MFFAFNAERKRVHINQTFVKEKYYCPICGEELTLKKGNEKAHHFAHKVKSVCKDNWHYDMSEWHIRWQEKFPEHTREVVLEKNGVKHRADVLIDGNIIEFQHSSLSCEEFEERNNFYTSLGYNVFWLFDLSKEYENEKILLLGDSNEKYRWIRPKNTFNSFDYKTKKVHVFFQFVLNANENEDWLNTKHIIETFGDSINEDYYYEHEYDTCYIRKLCWISPRGLEYFAARESYDDETFISLFIKKETIDINDYFIWYREKNNLYHYHGCPIKQNFSSNCLECRDCSFNQGEIYINDIEYLKCNKRISDLSLDYDKIKTVFRNDEKKITNVIINDGEEQKEIVLPPIQKIGTTLFELWDSYGCSIMRCKNLINGISVQVKYPKWQLLNKGKVYGKIKMPEGDYSDKEQEIYGAEKSIWIMEWFKTK